MINPLKGFVDSDFVGNVDTRKSLKGYIFTPYGTAISWRSVLQSIVALSTTEAIYIVMIEAVKEVMWLKAILHNFGISQRGFALYGDNQSSLHLVKHHVFHERSKHINVKLHFVRDVVERGIIIVKKVAFEDNPSDMLTKALLQVHTLM